jgi:hypothetical protein
MSWLDDRIKEDREREERLKLITDEASNMFDSLWKEIFEVIQEAKKKGFPIFTNGSEVQRVVNLSVNPGPNESSRSPKKITLKLAEDKLSISVSGAISLKFLLDVCPDMVVCLKHDGNHISVQNAARMILDRFLFPHLQKPTA